MVAIDSAHEIPAPAETAHTGQIVLFAFLGSALLAAASVVLNAGVAAAIHLEMLA